VNVIQNTTLAALIGVGEVLASGQREFERLAYPPPIGLGNGHGFAIYGAVLIVFFVISFPLTRLAAFLERRLV
jgi:polar amino acid transport system permease protein